MNNGLEYKIEDYLEALWLRMDSRNHVKLQAIKVLREKVGDAPKELFIMLNQQCDRLIKSTGKIWDRLHSARMF